MDALLDSIRIAVGDGASDEERRRGAAACRALAQALEGDLCASANTMAPVLVPRPDLAVAPLTALGANPFVGMTADQVLDLAIAKLRAAVGDGASAQPLGQPFRISLVPVPRMP
ncbi:MAG TPA: hypothetical protein VHE35_17035 [Kofleriaceae bacterium]|nr:hypothetical protein [Kofleriaceae bacterium]